MNRKWVALFLCFPLVVGGGAFAVNRYDVGWRSLGRASRPHAAVLTTVELPPQELGKVVLARFEIGNVGTAALTVSELRATCGCAGVERLVEGSFFQVTDVTVPPGEGVELFLRYAARGDAGGNQRSSVRFKTNDPDMPAGAGEIVHALRGGLAASPKSIQFGPVRGDKAVSQTIEIRDGGVAPPFVLGRAASDRPDLIRVTTKGGDEGGVVCRLEVVLEPSSLLGRISGNISLFAREAYRPALVIPVAAEILPAVQAIPSALVLPRRVGGRQVYQGEVVCRSTREEAVVLRVAEAADGLTAEIQNGANEKEKVVRIRWTPSKADEEPQVVKKTIRLIAATGGKETPVVIEVHCVPSKE